MARAVAGLLAFLVLAGFGQGWSRWLELAAVFRLHLGVLALLAVLILVIRRRKGPALVAGAAGLTALTALDMVWGPDERAGAPDGVPVRVLSANVFLENREVEAVAAALIAEDADILLTIETPRALGPLLAEAYPHVVRRSQQDRKIRNAVWSRLPLQNAGVNMNNNVGPLSAAAVVDVAPDARLGLIGVHFSRVWEGLPDRQVEGIGRMAAEVDAPLAIAGDFNAVPWQRLIGEVEAATGTKALGGYRVTWRGSYPGGPPEPWGHQIDHVLTAPGLGVRDVRTVPLPGSDHLGLAFTLIVPRADPDGETLSGSPGGG